MKRAQRMLSNGQLLRPFSGRRIGPFPAVQRRNQLNEVCGIVAAFHICLDDSRWPIVLRIAQGFPDGLGQIVECIPVRPFHLGAKGSPIPMTHPHFKRVLVSWAGIGSICINLWEASRGSERGQNHRHRQRGQHCLDGHDASHQRRVTPKLPGKDVR